MNGISRWRLSACLALLVAMGMTWGCAQDVGDIDRTQPDKIKKELFQNDDEWYLQQTIIDTEMEGGTMAFPALESPLKRIRWSITEDVLYAHSTVELAQGLNEGFDDEDARRLGVVAAFPIQGHFDVQRQYNAQTGEPTNIIVEDRSDRPWYDREYIRVDWSRNLVDGFRMFQGQLGTFSAVQSNIPQEDGSPHAHRTRISDDYIDTVTEYSFNPDIYSCFGAYGLDSIFNCEGGRTWARTAIQRIPDEKTYRPFNYLDTADITRDGSELGEPLMTNTIYDPELGYLIEVECDDNVKDWMLLNDGYDQDERCRKATFDFHQRFGYFRTENNVWDRYAGQRDTVDMNRRYYINRWNIWQSMYDLETEEFLEAPERVPQPITYHLNLEYPKFMFDAAQETAEEWSEAFRGAVKVAQGIDDAQLDAVLEDEYGHTQMFRIVENSCHPGPLVDWYNEFGSAQSDDRESVSGIFENYIGTTSGDASMENALWSMTNESRRDMCSHLEFATETRSDSDERFDWERFGDLRYSFFNWVEENVPWAGYGPSSADPTTGELIRGNANFAGGYIRQTANYAADVVQYFNGELSESDILHGTQIRQDLFNNRHEEDRFGLSPEGRRELSMRAGVDPSEISPSNMNDVPDVGDLDPFVLAHGIHEVHRQADIAASFGNKRGSRDERMVAVLELPTVKNLMLRDVEMAMAVEATAVSRHGESYDEEQFHQAYLDLKAPSLHSGRMQERDRLLAERNIMTFDALERSAESLITYQGVSDYFKGKSRDELIEYFMNRMFIGTQLHEIGHTVGLRHNFSAHADALNYYDEYWEIERAIHRGDITRQEAQSLQGDDLVAVLGEDAADYDYLSQSELQLASVMDYTADHTGRFSGLGKYDMAAIKFGYGEAVEQWHTDIDLPNLLSNQTFLSDYRQLPNILAGEYADEDDAFSRGIDIIQNGREYVPIKDAMETRRRAILDNTSNWTNYNFDEDSQPAMDRLVEYNFCSDEFRGQILDCAIWAYGANQQEMVNHSFDTYRALQTFWRHRRHNVSSNYQNVNRYINRLFSTFQVTQEPFRYYSIYRFYDYGDYTNDLQRAAIDGFNFYNEVFATPEKGRFCPFDESSTTIEPHWFYSLDNTYIPAEFHVDAGACANSIDIPQGQGQMYNYGFSNDYLYRIDRVGSYMDKLIAAESLFNISADFAQSAFFTDRGATNLSYWTVFKDEMLEMIGGVLLGDYQNYGAVVHGGKHDYPVPVDPDTFGHGMPNPNAGAPRIYTPQSVNHEFSLLVLGLINSDWEDREVDFTHYVKVATANDEWQEFGESMPIVEFEHPITGQLYKAADIEDRSVGARMVRRANELADRYIEAEQALENIAPGAQYDQMRSVRDLRREQMQDVVSKMDMVRYVIDATWSLR